MKNVQYEFDIYAEDDVFNSIDESERFSDYVGKCVTHFVHFVVPRRDQTQDICQDYEIPDSIDEVLESSLMLTRKSGNQIIISFTKW